MQEQHRQPGGESTRDRILAATLEVLSVSGPQRLSLSDVAQTARVSRPTLYRWFPSKQALLDAFADDEQARFDAGLAAAIAGLEGADRLDAVLQFVVDFQQSYSLRRMVDVEPDHVLEQIRRSLPTVRHRLRPHFTGPDADVVASIVTRIVLSHALVPDDDPGQFLTELRTASGLPTRSSRRPRGPRPRARRTTTAERAR
jgi:AcrR family transcriptional regulator